jgi:tripartite ATP-independent transporter DctM subunit
MISLPVMMRYGYNHRLATGVIAASGTITQLIPPSLVLVVLADQMGVSVGDLYLGAIGPSILQVTLFMMFIFAVSIFRPTYMPPLPPEARTLHGWPLIYKVLKGMVPSLVLIFLVLGTIFMGLATPTEAGAMGAVGSLILTWMNGRLTKLLIWQATDGTMRLTAMVVFILIGATIFSLVFHGVDGSKWIKDILTGLPGGQLGFLIVTNIFIFFVAFFLDFFEIAFIVVPLLVPVAKALDINIVWFAVLICVNLQTSFMHPPFGFALFYLRGIAPPSISSSDIYWGSVPWIILQLILVAIVIAYPETVTYWLSDGVVLDAGEVQKQLDSIRVPGMDTPGGTGDTPPLRF